MVTMQFFFKNSDDDPTTLIFVKQECIFEFNYTDMKTSIVHNFR